MLNDNTNLNEMIVFIKNNKSEDNIKKFKLKTLYS